MAYNQVIKTLCCLALAADSETHATASGAIVKEETAHSMNIQNLLQEYLEDSGAVGASVAIIDNGKVNFYTYGKKSVNENDLISEDTVFEIGSITKVFTSLLLADMVAKGQVQLDDPIEMYLPSVKIPELDDKKITLRHLATHTSGIPRMPDNFATQDPSNPYQDYTTERLYEYLRSCTLTKSPGESKEFWQLFSAEKCQKILVKSPCIFLDQKSYQNNKF